MRQETVTCNSAGYRTVAVPNGIDAESLKALQAAMSLEAVAA